MSLTITVPEDIAASVEELARRSGTSVQTLVLEALRAHFPPVPLELQAEFAALELASDEDFVRFERQLEEEAHAAG